MTAWATPATTARRKPNPQQADADDDGIGDACDACPDDGDDEEDDDDHDDDGERDDHDEDDDNDGHHDDEDEDDDNDGHHDNDDEDDDNDGIHDEDDDKSTRQTQQRSSSSALAGGQSADYSVPAVLGTLALAGRVQSPNAAVLRVEIYGPSGLLVGVSPPGLGRVSLQVPLPGIYTVRVRNTGATPVDYVIYLVRSVPWP